MIKLLFKCRETELYGEDLCAGESGYVHSPQSPSSSVPGPFDDLIEPVKKVQFEIGKKFLGNVQHDSIKREKKEVSVSRKYNFLYYAGGSSIEPPGEVAYEKRKHHRYEY